MGKVSSLGILIIAMLLIAGASCASVEIEPRPLPPAPEGTPLEVLASAVYLDDSGRLMRRGEDTIDVIGVEITVTDAGGCSQTKISAEYYVQFEMLAGHSYTIEATFNDSTKSTEAVINGFFEPEQGIRAGGEIWVGVWQSSDTIESVSYHEPLLL